MPFCPATRSSSLPRAPTQLTDSSRPCPASTSRSAFTVVSAGYTWPPVPPPVTITRTGRAPSARLLTWYRLLASRFVLDRVKPPITPARPGTYGAARLEWCQACAMDAPRHRRPATVVTRA